MLPISRKLRNDSPAGSSQYFSQEIGYEALAAFLNVVVGSLEIVRIPGVRNVPRAGSIIQQQMDFAVGVVRDDPSEVSYVVLLHADDVVEFVVVGGAYLPCAVACVGHVHLVELPLCGRIHVIPEFLPRSRGGSHAHAVRKALLFEHVSHHELTHYGPADVAVTYEEYFYHFWFLSIK